MSNTPSTEDEIKILNEHVESLEDMGVDYEEIVDKKNRKLEKKNVEIKQLRNSLGKSQEQVKLYAGQRKETKGDQMSALEKVLTNRVSMSEINAIRHLLKGFSIYPIINNDVKLVTVQRIFSGLLEGVIPITSPQSLFYGKTSDDGALRCKRLYKRKYEDVF